MILLLWGCSSKESKSLEAPSQGQSPNLEERRGEVIEVIPQTVSYQLTAIGSLKSPETVKISPKKAGIIKKIFVKEGDTVKTIDQRFLERPYGQTDYQGLRILAIDEISIRKGHRYLTG